MNCGCDHHRRCSYHQAIIIMNAAANRGARMMEVVTLTCRECGKDGNLRMPHSSTNSDILSRFRAIGWTVGDDGKQAKCPKHR